MTTKIIIDFFSNAIVSSNYISRNMFPDAELSTKCHPQPFISRNFSLDLNPPLPNGLSKKAKRGAMAQQKTLACAFEKTNKKSHIWRQWDCRGISQLMHGWTFPGTSEHHCFHVVLISCWTCGRVTRSESFCSRKPFAWYTYNKHRWFWIFLLRIWCVSFMDFGLCT